MIAALLLFFATQSWAGGEVGNGGDTVSCTDGDYALDFLMTEGDGQEPVPAASWDASRARLSALLHAKYPDLGTLFDDFAASFPVAPDPDPARRYLRPRIWEAAPYGLVNLQDQRITRKLPATCLPPALGVIQTVIREKPGHSTLYQYDPQILRALPPLQLSFLAVHEWLWDFTSDVELIRRVNRLLHSPALESLSAAELRASLANIGFSLARPEYVPVCERLPAVRDALERNLRVPCDSITEELLQTSKTEVILTGVPLDGLGDGDLSGLSTGRNLTLAGGGLTFLFEDLFAGMLSVSNVDLSGNQITVLPENLLAATPQLTQIKLGGNRISSIPPRFFLNAPGLIRIDLSGNELTSFPPGLLTPNSRMQLVLTGNPLDPAKVRADYPTVYITY
jgi:hypothetical protein